jgi:4-carboxymuconolactone decarboxylase
VQREHEDLLRRLALNDEETMDALFGTSLDHTRPSGLDPRTQALTRLAALIATESAGASYQWAIDSALAAGAGEDDVVDVLAAVAPIVGLARAASAASELVLALSDEVIRPSER